jgi:hypothetical protein
MARLGNASRLEIHILKSYSTLRWAMALLGLILPPLLVFGGIAQLWWLEHPLPAQTSLSAYYHAGADCLTSSGVYRNLFVGVLCAIGACLVIYSGFSKMEDWLLNIAGALLVLVALFPTSWSAWDLVQVCPDFKPFVASKLFGLPIAIHYAVAILFFVAITAVNVLTAFDSVRFISTPQRKALWMWVFRFARFLMPASLLIGWLLSMKFDPERWILWIEWSGVWAFSCYWLLKSIEICDSGVDLEMIAGNIDFAANQSRQLERVGD